MTDCDLCGGPAEFGEVIPVAPAYGGVPVTLCRGCLRDLVDRLEQGIRDQPRTSPTAGAAMATTVNRYTVVFDSVGYLHDDAWRSARRGEVVELDASQAQRHLGLGAIRQWRPGDPDPVEVPAGHVRVLPPTRPPTPVEYQPPRSLEEIDSARPARELVERMYSDVDDEVRPPLEEFFRQREALAAEREQAERAYKPHRREHHQLIAEQIREQEARRVVAERRAARQEAEEAAERAEYEQEVATEIEKQSRRTS